MQGAPLLVKKTNNGVWYIIILLCGVHFINDTTQALLPAIYPTLQQTYSLSLLQLGVITATFQLTGSLLQPMVGYYGDKKSIALALASCFIFALIGIIILSYTKNYYCFILGSAFFGLASSIFHPEAARIARFASGGKYGTAQSTFQIGGNLGTAIAPLLAALFIYNPRQLIYIAPFSLLGLVVLVFVSNWYIHHSIKNKSLQKPIKYNSLGKSTIIFSIFILIGLMFAKYIYLSTFQNYYTLYVIDRFHLSVRSAQIMLFLFLGGIAMGTIFGGPLGDRFGSRTVIWFSILGVLPFSIALPYVGLVATAILSIIVGTILASAFPAIVVYAQELVPGKVGTIGGFMYGFAYGIGGLSSCAMGYIGDYIGLQKLFIISGFLPLLGILTIFLPKFKN